MGINKYRVVGEEKKRKKERKKENRTKDRTTRNRGMKNNVVIVYRDKSQECALTIELRDKQLNNIRPEMNELISRNKVRINLFK